MPRAFPSGLTLIARLRRYYGLRQAELATMLGLSAAQLSHLESGRRSIGPAVRERLAPFLAVMEAAPEPPTPAGPAAEDPDTPPPGPFAPGPLERRRRTCLYEAHNLRWQLRQLPEQAAVAARWAEALPRLRAMLSPPPPEGEAPRTQEAVRLRYVHSWLETEPLALEPEELALWHLRHQRALALEAEAAALTVLLAQAATPQASGGATTG